MKYLFLILSFSTFASEKVSLPEDFGTWNCGAPVFTKLGKCEIRCDFEGCKVFCRER